MVVLTVVVVMAVWSIVELGSARDTRTKESHN